MDTRTLKWEKSIQLSSLLLPHLLGGGGEKCFLKQALIFLDSSEHTKSSVVSVSKHLAGQFDLKAGSFLCLQPAC
jgi:hypothetical protein